MMVRIRVMPMIPAVRILAVVILALSSAAEPQFAPQEIAERSRWEQFMREAKIKGAEQLGIDQGVTEPWRLILEKDGVTRRALWKNPRGNLHGFIEGWQYEIAAYRLDKLLGLNMVPPTVEKRFRGKPGSCQLWIEDTELLRTKIEEGLDPEVQKTSRWMRMGYLQQVFDNLIGNEDRHVGNVLVTEDNRTILIDHSRSFRTAKEFTEEIPITEEKAGMEVMRELPRDFIARVRALSEASIRKAIGSYLKKKEINAMLARKTLLLAEIDRMISKYGEASVLY